MSAALPRGLRLAGGLAGALLAAACSGSATIPLEGHERFSQAVFDEVLGRHVRGGGVDYGSLRSDPDFHAFLEEIARADPASFRGLHQRAFWINAYNACVLRAVSERWPLASVRDVQPLGRSTFFREVRFRVAGRDWSLDEIEHRLLRAEADEPRIHFAISKASRGAARLRAEAYHGERLDQELEEATRAFVNDPERVQLDPDRGTLRLSPIFEWYGEDFEERYGSVARFLARYLPAEPGRALLERPLRIVYLPYDWSINAADPVREEGAPL